MDFSPADLVKDLWRNKPLFIAVIVGLAAVVYLIYKNASNTTSSATTTAPTTSGGTFIEDSYPVYVPVSTTTNTGASMPVASTGNGTPTPLPGPRSFGPNPNQGTSQTGTVQTTTTVAVTAWPSQTSTLWGIAEKVYGNGALWPQIYAANKSIIGSNPNALKTGQKLVIPPKS